LVHHGVIPDANDQRTRSPRLGACFHDMRMMPWVVKYCSPASLKPEHR
jgi:hypothetical protein